MALNPATRLKVKADTVYLPDTEGGVYFRSNSGSFRMTGSMMDRWIEKLFPAWSGGHTMEELTEGLPEAHRSRIYEIGDTLLQNGFVRDVSQDLPHSLTDDVQREFAAQIDFLDNQAGSGGHRFQLYREAKVLAVGRGWFGVTLASALLQSGLPRFHLLMTDSEAAQHQRVAELAAYARHTDPEVLVEEISPPETGTVAGWAEIIAPYDWVLYVSSEEGIGQLRVLHPACRQTNKTLLPAVFVGQIGVAGPVVSSETDACWESAWRRLHRSAVSRDPELHQKSPTAEAMLANVLAFDLFKAVTGVAASELHGRLFLLDLETLEGSRHTFLPHPLLADIPRKTEYRTVDRQLPPPGSDKTNGLLPWFDRLTSSSTGILHLWGEGDERQLPLSVCRVQPADPLSEGPAELLPELVCGGFTHEEARREAGLAGIESYMQRLASSEAGGSVAVGETDGEGLCRGLRKSLIRELGEQLSVRRPVLYRVRLTEMRDERVRFYLTSLITMLGNPVIAAGEGVSGFPEMWVGSGGTWYGSSDFTRTGALRDALLMALMKQQAEAENVVVPALQAASVILAANEPYELQIPAIEEADHERQWHSAVQHLKRSGKNPSVVQWKLEPILEEQLSGAFVVSLREEDAP